MALWRLHIRPYGGEANHPLAVSFCLRNSLIGMGWAVPNEPVTQSYDLRWYKDAAARHYGEDRSWASVVAFATAAIGDIVWFRNLEGRYYVAELTAPWEYRYTNLEQIAADIVNFRSARIVEVGLADAVPGKIISCFRPARTFQSILSPGMLAFSTKLLGIAFDAKSALLDVYEFMSDADIEDLVFVYLQFIGWYVVPGTRRLTTSHYEFVLISQTTGERAIVQVKSGNTPLDAASYTGEERTFLFATSESYGSSVPENVTILSRGELNNFMSSKPELLPAAVRTWIGMAGFA